MFVYVCVFISSGHIEWMRTQLSHSLIVNGEKYCVALHFNLVTLLLPTQFGIVNITGIYIDTEIREHKALSTES